MGSCASTGVSQAGSPAKSQLTNGIQQTSFNIQEMNQTEIRNINEEGDAMAGQEKKTDNPRSNYVLSGIDLLDYGVGLKDIPLRTSDTNMTTDEELDMECALSGVSQFFYKNLTTCTLGQYAQIPNDTDMLRSVNTPESLRACYVRMRHIYRMIETDRMGKATLMKNIQYAINVMENAYIAEKRRIREEEEDLSEAATEYVPDEVRNWLASTFTRTVQSVGIGDQKPRFRSVANAIRAGIFTGLDTWNFDVFGLNEASENHALKFVAFELLHKYNLINKFQINSTALESLLIQLETGYSKYSNPYHNLVHAADVMQTCHMIIFMNDLRNWLNDLDIFAVLFAAVIHDYEHTGTTNNFHIATRSELALIYNDRGVLENHHVSAVFRLMQEEEFSILTGLEADQYKEFRQLVIDMVLCTDMSLHFQQIKNMKTMISMPESIDKTKALSLIVHCADISHPAKEWALHEQWSDILCEEFFRQGDRERELNLPISPLCDRFIDFIVEPSFQVLGDMIERIVNPTQTEGVLPTDTTSPKPKSSDQETGMFFFQLYSIICLY
ncbi:putative calcium/calmodulin-dependent 3,5-cyclic nucleotide phosphodiesterase [Schistosoma mansoni]|uniref:putative calcium/calmodulin-dependent 3,5-cyclic nucleotide phosphodiesterase n=1 Tax=Schistosoma mansoni TaxID=6183 RepID=UPI00022DC122|nr:putative calcium/calmodulin-dependent 3,5-cyclic nucleotide phosphodiesterase [Schistosoma mansoni]|eukprot:XP_018653649.1 putative calcium/calmodulin-dependent 3,5-cyclic nucleotide phosphodiesterase [Schistosoma mansoni]